MKRFVGKAGQFVADKSRVGELDTARNGVFLTVNHGTQRRFRLLLYSLSSRHLYTDSVLLLDYDTVTIYLVPFRLSFLIFFYSDYLINHLHS